MIQLRRKNGNIPAIQIAFFILLTFFPLTTLRGQQVFFNHYTTRSGLPNEFVTSIIQDKQGFIWIGTPEGLCRFDGERFKMFGKQQGLNDIHVLNLLSAPDGRIWVTSRMEIGCIENGSYRTMQRDSTYQGYRDKPITLTGDGDICFATTRGVAFLDSESGKLTEMDVDLPIYRVQCLDTDNRGRVYIGTSSGMCIMENGRIVERLEGDALKYHFLSINTNCPDTVYLGTWAGLYKLSADTLQTILPLSEFRQSVRALAYDSTNSRLWFGGSNLGLMRRDNGIITRYSTGNGLPSNTIRCLLVDRNSNLWIGTDKGATVYFNQGLMVYPNSEYNFSDRFVSISRDLTGGLFLESSDNSIFSMPSPSDSSFRRYPSRIILNKPQAILRNLSLMNPGSSLLARNVNITTLPSSSDSLNRLVAADPSFDIFLGPGESLFLIESRKHRGPKRTFLWRNGKSSELSVELSNIPEFHNFKYLICQLTTSDGRILFGGEFGLWYLDGNVVRQYNDIDELKIRTIHQILEDNQGTVWYHTDKGVYYTRNGSTRCMNDDYPELQDNLYYIVFDEEQNLWLLGDRYLAVYKDGTLEKFDLPINLILFNTAIQSCAIDKEGVLWVLSSESLVRLDLKTIRNRKSAPKILIERVKVSGNEVDLSSETQIYDYKHNNIEIDFTGIYFEQQKPLTFKVSLSDGNQIWEHETSSHSFNISNLRPGNYSFAVRLEHPPGTKAQTPANFKFRITPPFWERVWFWGSSIFFVLFSIVAAFRYRTYHLKKERNYLEQKVREKNHELLELNENLEDQVLQRTGELLESKDEYRNLLKIIPVCILTTDMNGRIKLVNQMFTYVFGYMENEVIGENFRALFQSPEHVVPELEKKLGETGAIRGFETGMLTAGGNLVNIIINAETIYSGKEPQREFALTDITLLKNLEEKLRRSERLSALGEMASSLAHEIRNPVTALKLNFEMIAGSSQLSDEIRSEVFSQMQRGISKLDTLIKEILDFSNPKSPEIKIRDINETIRNALLIIGAKLSEKQIACKLNLTDKPLSSNIDRELIENVWINVISNAIDATDIGGKISIDSHKNRDGTIEVVISDSGIGMQPEEIDKIFEPFYSNKRKGTGLGLAISKKVLDFHNCTVSVESNPGVGTVFSVIFPDPAEKIA